MDEDIMLISEAVYIVARTWLIMGLVAMGIFLLVYFAERYQYSQTLKYIVKEHSEKEEVKHG